MPLLDELMANAWPPVVVELRHGWRFRWALGVTRRANSVLAVGSDGDLAELISEAEAFYGGLGAPTLIQVTTASASPNLVPCLEERGYRPTARTFVERAATDDVLDRTRAGSFEIETTEAPTDEWFETYWSVESTRGRADADIRVCRDTLLAPALPTVFGVARRGSEVLGVGQLVIERGWAGVQCMATSPVHRRQGVASAVLHTLAEEALRHGAAHMYLAVMASNIAAMGLYERSGFAPVHEYSYFISHVE
jgi:ribosomal protein S18 acetylase RimI-like enzyme